MWVGKWDRPGKSGRGQWMWSNHIVRDSQRANYKENIPVAAAVCAAVCGLCCHLKPCKGVGKDLVLVKRLINGSLALLQWVYGQHKLTLWGFFWWGVVVVQDGKVNLEGMGGECYQDALYKIPK